ncbi:MAG: hypothetical protein ACRC8S_06900 [Fimbriiglobus sp.]
MTWDDDLRALLMYSLGDTYRFVLESGDELTGAIASVSHVNVGATSDVIVEEAGGGCWRVELVAIRKMHLPDGRCVFDRATPLP